MKQQGSTGQDVELEFDNPVSDTFDSDAKPKSFETDGPGADAAPGGSPRSRERARQKREAKKAAKLAAASATAEFQIVGDSLGTFGADSPVRIACFQVTTSWAFENFILLLILFGSTTVLSF